MDVAGILKMVMVHYGEDFCYRIYNFSSYYKDLIDNPDHYLVK